MTSDLMHDCVCCGGQLSTHSRPLLLQRQEELAKDRARKEKIQQEDAERKARKKVQNVSHRENSSVCFQKQRVFCSPQRLEEIMRRTRGADPADTVIFQLQSGLQSPMMLRQHQLITPVFFLHQVFLLVFQL